jgi:hypothetical protein
MRVVTTCHKEGFDLYGHRVLEGFKHWPKGTELWWYTEGFKLPKTDGIVEVSTESLLDLASFKEQHGRYIAPNYLYDVVRFSNKVFAVNHALSDYKGIGVWMDADCVTFNDIPEGFIEGHLQGAYIALFKRKGMYSETGFWVMDCSHPAHHDFMETWTRWYKEGLFKEMPNWTDCETLDTTIRLFEKKDLIKSVSLSGDFEKTMHPMSKVGFGRYIDHCKGGRKQQGFSPENRFRNAA